MPSFNAEARAAHRRIQLLSGRTPPGIRPSHYPGTKPGMKHHPEIGFPAGRIQPFHGEVMGEWLSRAEWYLKKEGIVRSVKVARMPRHPKVTYRGLYDQWEEEILLSSEKYGSILGEKFNPLVQRHLEMTSTLRHEAGHATVFGYGTSPAHPFGGNRLLEHEGTLHHDSRIIIDLHGSRKSLGKKIFEVQEDLANQGHTLESPALKGVAGTAESIFGFGREASVDMAEEVIVETSAQRALIGFYGPERLNKEWLRKYTQDKLAYNLGHRSSELSHDALFFGYTPFSPAPYLKNPTKARIFRPEEPGFFDHFKAVERHYAPDDSVMIAFQRELFDKRRAAKELDNTIRGMDPGNTIRGMKTPIGHGVETGFGSPWSIARIGKVAAGITKGINVGNRDITRASYELERRIGRTLGTSERGMSRIYQGASDSVSPLYSGLKPFQYKHHIFGDGVYFGDISTAVGYGNKGFVIKRVADMNRSQREKFITTFHDFYDSRMRGSAKDHISDFSGYHETARRSLRYGNIEPTPRNVRAEILEIKSGRRGHQEKEITVGGGKIVHPDLLEPVDLASHANAWSQAARQQAIAPASRSIDYGPGFFRNQYSKAINPIEGIKRRRGRIGNLVNRIERGESVNPIDIRNRALELEEKLARAYTGKQSTSFSRLEGGYVTDPRRVLKRPAFSVHESAVAGLQKRGLLQTKTNENSGAIFGADVLWKGNRTRFELRPVSEMSSKQQSLFLNTFHDFTQMRGGGRIATRGKTVDPSLFQASETRKSIYSTIDNTAARLEALQKTKISKLSLPERVLNTKNRLIAKDPERFNRIRRRVKLRRDEARLKASLREREEIAKRSQESLLFDDRLAAKELANTIPGMKKGGIGHGVETGFGSPWNPNTLLDPKTLVGIDIETVGGMWHKEAQHSGIELAPGLKLTGITNPASVYSIAAQAQTGEGQISTVFHGRLAEDPRVFDPKYFKTLGETGSKHKLGVWWNRKQVSEEGMAIMDELGLLRDRHVPKTNLSVTSAQLEYLKKISPNLEHWRSFVKPAIESGATKYSSAREMFTAYLDALEKSASGITGYNINAFDIPELQRQMDIAGGGIGKRHLKLMDKLAREDVMDLAKKAMSEEYGKLSSAIKEDPRFSGYIQKVIGQKEFTRGFRLNDIAEAVGLGSRGSVHESLTDVTHTFKVRDRLIGGQTPDIQAQLESSLNAAREKRIKVSKHNDLKAMEELLAHLKAIGGIKPSSGPAASASHTHARKSLGASAQRVFNKIPKMPHVSRGKGIGIAIGVGALALYSFGGNKNMDLIGESISGAKRSEWTSSSTLGSQNLNTLIGAVTHPSVGGYLDPQTAAERKKSKRVMQQGSIIGERVAEELIAAGLASQSEVYVEDPVNKVFGYADVLSREGIPIEVKTISSEGFRQLRGPKPQHASQANFYAIGMNTPYAQILYVNRDDPDERKSFNISADWTTYSSDLAKMKMMQQRYSNLGIGGGSYKSDWFGEGSAKGFRPLDALFGSGFINHGIAPATMSGTGRQYTGFGSPWNRGVVVNAPKRYNTSMVTKTSRFRDQKHRLINMPHTKHTVQPQGKRHPNNTSRAERANA